MGERAKFAVARHGALEGVAVRVGNAGHEDAVDALRLRRRAVPPSEK